MRPGRFSIWSLPSQSLPQNKDANMAINNIFLTVENIDCHVSWEEDNINEIKKSSDKATFELIIHTHK